MKSLLSRIAAAAVATFAASSCMTTYDAQGNPVQTVDPGAAAAAAITAAAVGYAVGHNHNRKDYYYQPYYRPYYRQGPYCRY